MILSVLVVLDGEVAAPCNPQSAIAGSKPNGGLALWGLPKASSEEDRVLRNINL